MTPELWPVCHGRGCGRSERGGSTNDPEQRSTTLSSDASLKRLGVTEVSKGLEAFSSTTSLNSKPFFETDTYAAGTLLLIQFPASICLATRWA